MSATKTICDASDPRTIKIIDKARDCVRQVVHENGLKNPKQLRRALFHAYPFKRRVPKKTGPTSTRIV